jgi:hypothetical protein
MFRRAILLFPALLLLAAQTDAAPVPPQPKPDDSVSASAVKLLQHRKVQKELKMTAEQRVTIFDGLADIEEDYEAKIEVLARMPNPPEEAYDKLDKDRQKATEKLLTDSATKSLSGVQRTRLRQLDWRLRGAAAFTDPQVDKKLQLTDAQKKKAADIVERIKGEVSRYFDNLGNGNGDDAKAKKDLFAYRKDRLKEMVDALTDDQKTAWTDMIGEDTKGFALDDLWLKVEEEMDTMLPGIIGKG